MSDTWEPPETYWIIDTENGRYRIPEDIGQHLMEMLDSDAFSGWYTLTDIYGQQAAFRLESVHALLESTAEGRYRVNTHEAELSEESREAEHDVTPPWDRDD